MYENYQDICEYNSQQETEHFQSHSGNLPYDDGYNDTMKKAGDAYFDQKGEIPNQKMINSYCSKYSGQQKTDCTNGANDYLEIFYAWTYTQSP